MAGDAERQTRRFVISIMLGTVLTTATVVADRAGLLDGDGSTDPLPVAGPWEGAPVVDNGAAPTDTVTVRVRVVAGDRRLKDELVVLRDAEGTFEDRLGRTGPRGRIVFEEAVGSVGCHDMQVFLPARGQGSDLGCLTGDTTVERVIDVEAGVGGEVTAAGGSADDPWADAPVADDGEDAEELARVRVRVFENGSPAVRTVTLRNHSDDESARVAVTGLDGRLVFEEHVGDSCDRLELDVVGADRRIDLGCVGGGQTVDRAIELD